MGITEMIFLVSSAIIGIEATNILYESSHSLSVFQTEKIVLSFV